MSLSIDQLGVAPSTQDRVAQAAVRLFSDRGFAATGIRDLGREVGLTSASLYHYVAHKEELLVSVMSACLTEYLRGARAAVASTGDPLVQLCRLIHFHVGAECTNPLTSRVTDRELRSLTGDSRGSVVAHRDELESIYGDVIERGADNGVFHLIDPTVSRLVLVEMCNSVANWYRPDGSLTVAELQDRYAQLARRIVGCTSRKQIPVGPESASVRLPSEPPPTAP